TMVISRIRISGFIGRPSFCHVESQTQSQVFGSRPSIPTSGRSADRNLETKLAREDFVRAGRRVWCRAALPRVVSFQSDPQGSRLRRVVVDSKNVFLNARRESRVPCIPRHESFRSWASRKTAADAAPANVIWRLEGRL